MLFSIVWNREKLGFSFFIHFDFINVCIRLEYSNEINLRVFFPVWLVKVRISIDNQIKLSVSGESVYIFHGNKSELGKFSAEVSTNFMLLLRSFLFALLISWRGLVKVSIRRQGKLEDLPQIKTICVSPDTELYFLWKLICLQINVTPVRIMG